MTTVADQVLEETKRFRAVLPSLLKTHRGKWVVFLNGEVKSAHDDETSAYADAIRLFGPDVPYVIAPIVETAPTPVTAAVAFGLSYA